MRQKRDRNPATKSHRAERKVLTNLTHEKHIHVAHHLALESRESRVRRNVELKLVSEEPFSICMGKPKVSASLGSFPSFHRYTLARLYLYISIDIFAYLYLHLYNVSRDCGALLIENDKTTDGSGKVLFTLQ